MTSAANVIVIDGTLRTPVGEHAVEMSADRAASARAHLVHRELATRALDPETIAPGQRVTIVRTADTILGGVSLIATDARWVGRHLAGGQTGWQASTLDQHPTVRAVPTLGQLRDEELQALPRYDTLAEAYDDAAPTRTPIGLAAYGSWPVLGQLLVGAAWLLYAYDPDTDIAEGFLALPADSPGVSEHGSVYGADLLHRGQLGTLPVPAGLTFEHCLQLEDLTLQVLTGRAELRVDPLLESPAGPRLDASTDGGLAR